MSDRAAALAGAIAGALTIALMSGMLGALIMAPRGDRPAPVSKPKAMEVAPHPRCFAEGVREVEMFVACPDGREREQRAA